jgi:hypothetical protein
MKDPIDQAQGRHTDPVPRKYPMFWASDSWTTKEKIQLRRSQKHEKGLI